MKHGLQQPQRYPGSSLSQAAEGLLMMDRRRRHQGAPLAGLQPITRRRAAGVVKALSFLHHHHTVMRNLHTGISSSRNTSFIPAAPLRLKGPTRCS
ncbi:hypothetical protein NQZ68_033525 [Dissostichus eleginoides]|nr:hypothetical protein NQZ68_033525 [Dissostichus eleginoides]